MVGLGERFWSKVTPGPGGCLIWQAAKDHGGYGKFWYGGRDCSAHRVSFEAARGAVPDGLQLDHLCRRRDCVNPLHLQPVTQAENLRRGVSHNGSKTHCLRGHEYTADNTVVQATGRTCKACRRIRNKASV